MSTRHRLLVLTIFCLLTLSGHSATGSEGKIGLEQDTVNFTIFMNNDQHGHILADEGKGSAAQMITHLKNNGYDPEDPTHMLVSGGDHNTGGPIASLTAGEAMIDVMNVMGFDYAAIGNHEFDWGQQAMFDQLAQANFPLLGANIMDKETGEVANFSTPWVIDERGGVNIGWIGLTTTESNTWITPWMIDKLEIAEYEPTVRQSYAELKEAGADIVLVLAHVPPSQLAILANAVSDLDIPIMFGGHNQGQANYVSAGSTVVATEHFGAEFAKVTFDVNTQTKTVENINTGFIENSDNVAHDEAVEEIIDFWDCLIPQEMVISHSSDEIFRGGETMRNILSNSLLHYYYSIGKPASFSMVSGGAGVRDDFKAGPVTLGNTINVLPWPDTIVEIYLSGSFLDSNLFKIISSNLYSTELLVEGDVKHILDNGEWVPLNSSKTYTVLMPIFHFLSGATSGVKGILDSQGVEYSYNITKYTHRNALLNYINNTEELTEVPNYIFEDGVPENLATTLTDMDSILDYSDKSKCTDQFYHLTTSVNGQGSISVDQGLYEEGTVLTLTATPIEGWEFKEWQGDFSSPDNPVTLVMDSNKTVTAVFEEIVPKTSLTTTDTSTSTSEDGTTPLYFAIWFLLPILLRRKLKTKLRID